MTTGSGLVINGRAELAPGLNVVNYLDDPALRLGDRDRRPRNPPDRWVHVLIVHSTRGIPGGSDARNQDIRPGFGPSQDRARGLVRYWTGDANCAGAHLIVDFDGKITCTADLQAEAAFHAGNANEVSVGIEIVQGGDAEMYESQLGVVVLLCDWLTKRFGIQRTIPHRYVGPSRRLMEGLDDVVGVIGHRDVTNRRGPGDPGQRIFNLLGAAGYEAVDYDLRADLALWRRRQRDLGVTADGIPGSQTRTALAAAEEIRGLTGARPEGLWIVRPGDAGGPPVPAPF